MLRARKGVDWARYLPAEDLPYLQEQIAPDGWYPMATFERLGNAILAAIASGNLDAVRIWGRMSLDQIRATHPQIIEPGDPLESLNRFRVFRSTFFDFDALEVVFFHEGEAQIAIDYQMGMPAEEAASVQTLGFFERLVDLAGGTNVWADLTERAWNGDPRTLLKLRWQSPLTSR